MSENVKESESSVPEPDGRGEPLTPSGSECAEMQDSVTTTLSGSDIVSKPSGIPGLKTSGIKPPSKIGRPCSGQAKPALPPVPAKNSPDSDFRRDDYRRQKLTDVEEEVDGTDVESIGRRSASPSPRKTRNYSVSSNMSMDTLWDLHPRRLSEAGLRRHSDTSVVLTEDTDCFIIGMRVWVGGTKPGQIAYIGETQFAPGDWAGIVLDEPIGKNDGSVSGTRYFQCEPRKGVFSRLTRLTLTPLTDSTLETSMMRTPPPSTPTPSPMNGTRKSISPAGSTRSIARPSTSLNTSTMSLSSDIKIGDRVIVQSSQGSKPGTLRFVGATDFAKGEWCGVELDDPLGKNDGSVEGKSYFRCEPKFGLFAPIAKVSKSPSSRRPGAAQCVVHKAPPSGLSTPALRRQGSRESMSSMMSATSAASGVRRKTITKVASTPVSKSPLQDVIREKEHHIEQLLKEREIDRSEITRAAGIAEKAEGKFLNLQQEYEKYRVETEGKFKEHTSIVSQLEKKLQQLSVQLEDEKKKLEDAQFRFEEENLTKDDIQAVNTNQLTKIKQLEEDLENERKKNDKLEQEWKQRLFESEEQLTKVQQELEMLRNAQQTNTRCVQRKDTEILQLKEQLIHEQQRINAKDRDIEMLVAEKEALLREQQESLVRMKDELNTSNKLLKESHFANELNLLKELKKAEMELSAKRFDCETHSEKVKQLEAKLQYLESELDSAKSPESESDKEKRLKANIEEIRNILRNTVGELLRVRKEYAIELLERDISLREGDIKLKYELSEMEKAKQEFQHSIVELTQSSKAHKDRYNKQIEIRNQQIQELLRTLQSKSQELIAFKVDANKLQIELAENNVAASTLKSELELLTSKHVEQSAHIGRLVEELQLAKLKASEYERKYCSATETILHLQDIKKQHEAKFKATIEAAADSTGQLTILNEEIKRIECSLEMTRVEMAKKLDAAADIEQQLRIELELKSDAYNQQKKHFEQQVALLQSTASELKGKLQSLGDDSNATHEKQEQQLVALTSKNYNNEMEYKAQIDANVDKIKELEQILEMAVAEHQQVASELSRRIEQLAVERDQLRASVKERAALLVESEEKVKQYLLNNDSVHEKEMHSLKNHIEQYQEDLQRARAQVQQQTEEISHLRNTISSLEQEAKRQTDNLHATNDDKTKLTSLYEELKKNLEQSEEKQNQLVLQINAFNEEKHNLEKVINEHQLKITSLTDQLKKGQDENANIRNLLTERDEQILAINEQVNKIKADIIEKDSFLAEKDNKMKALTLQLEQIIKEKGTTSETFVVQENKIMELNMELQKVAQEKCALNNNIQAKEQELLELKAKAANSEGNLTKKLNEKEAQVAALEQQIEAAKVEQANVAKSVGLKEENVVRLQKEIDVLKSENNEMNKLNADMNKKIQEFEENESTRNKSHNETIALFESNIKEKESRIEALQLELETLRKDWENPINNPTVEKLNAALKEKETILDKNISEIKDLNERLNEITKEQLVHIEKISALEKQLVVDAEKLTKEKNDLNNLIRMKDDELSLLKEKIKSEKQGISTVLKQKEGEISELKKQIELVLQDKANEVNKVENSEQNISKLNAEMEALKIENNKLNSTIKESNEKLLKLNEQVQKCGDNDVQQSVKINELENMLQQKEAMISELDRNVDMLKNKLLDTTDKCVVEDLQGKLNEKENLLRENTDTLNSLNSQLQTFEKENYEIQRSWKGYVQQWKTKLQNLENIRKIAAEHCDTLEQQVKILTSQQTENANDVMSKDVNIKPVKFDEFKKEIDFDSGELYKALDKAQQLVIEREKELNHVRNTSLNLQKQLEQTEKKIIEVTTSVNKQKSGIPKPKDKDVKEAATCDMDTYKKMLEEKEFAVGQVEFLNSIIVDMKQKNEELQSKIQILENGYVEESGTSQEKINRVIPPRQYCDICEMFDLHETEDCPVQMTGDAPVIVNDININRNLPAQRPYCEICEEFGHNTENCDADETY